MKNLLLITILFFIGLSAKAKCRADIPVSSCIEAKSLVELEVTKTSWSSIGNQDGEVVATVKCDITPFDHFEAEIRCQEDPDQYITFANLNSSQGSLVCYTWEGGYYDLNKGYHYTLIVKAFDVPYYGVEPCETVTYEFVGTGKEPAVYSDIQIVNVDLVEDILLYHGYDIDGTTFDVTFSEPVSKVNVWAAKGMAGSIPCSAEQKSDDGTVWTIILTDGVLSQEGSSNIMIQAWDANGVLARGENGDHAFGYNLFIAESDPNTDPNNPVVNPNDTIDDPEPIVPSMSIEITKTDWSQIGNQDGEIIGTINSNIIPFDHYEFSITCVEDPSIFITFANLNSVAGDIVCFSWEGGTNVLCNGYHYTLTVKAFDSPYYGVEPCSTNTFEFIGTGAVPVKYSDITVTNVGLNVNEQGLGYDISDTSFEITFSASVLEVKAWAAMGLEGSVDFTATRKSEDGTAWVISIPESMLDMDGSFNVNIIAYDAEGNPLKLACEDTPYAFNAIPQVEPEPVPAMTAIINIDSISYILSETDAVELDVYPEGAFITIANADESVMKMTYEVIDLTTNEICKSMSELSKETTGIWSAVMPKSYNLIDGHDFCIHVKAFDGVSSFTSQLLFEYNYKVKGTNKNVAVYSKVGIASVTPNDSEVLTTNTPTIKITFTEAIASLSVTAITGQQMTVDIPVSNINTDDNITWEVSVPRNCVRDGMLSLNFVAVDNEGNRVTDPLDGVGSPESCYVQYLWSVSVELPKPGLEEDGKTLEQIESLTFTYEGIGLNHNNSVWKNITIAKDSAPVDIAITEDLFMVSGDESVGGTKLTLTLPEPIKTNGEYTITVPMNSFVLGHDQSNMFNAECKFQVTVKVTDEPEIIEPTIALNITKTDWATIGNDEGELIGTIGGTFDKFDHFEAEIRCEEDPDQYIVLSRVFSIGGVLKCTAWEGGYYDLMSGYHYTITVKAYDTPFYGVEPVAIATYEFVGTGITPIVYSDIAIESTSLKINADALGWDIEGSDFDVTFTAPVSKVNAWAAMGMEGSVPFSTIQKSDDGSVWTIFLPESMSNTEGSYNVQITAWDMNGNQIYGENGDHAYGYQIVTKAGDLPQDPIQITKYISVERIEGQGYTAEDVAYNQAEILSELGAENWADLEIYPVVLSTNNLKGTDNDGWRDLNGDPVAWQVNGAGNGLCLKYPHDGAMSLCTHPGNDPKAGTTLTAAWACIYGVNSVILNISVSFVEAPKVEMSVVDLGITTSQEYEIAEGSYMEKKSTLSSEDIEAICAELGISSLAEATIYGYNPTNQELISSYSEYDGWRNTDGDFANWTGNESVPVCVKIQDNGASYLFNIISDIEAKSYKCYWAIANATKAVLVECVVVVDLPNRIVNVDIPVDAAIYTLSGVRVLPSQMQRGGLYIVNGQKVRL